MGCYSFLYSTSGKADQCTIDWSAINIRMLSGYSRLQYIAEGEGKGETERPTNLAKLAERLDESKLFGYFTHEMKMALMELCEGLVPYEVDGQPGRPKLYFDVEGEEDIAMIEFVPGTSTVYVASIPMEWIEDIQKELRGEDYILELDSILESLTKKIPKEEL